MQRVVMTTKMDNCTGGVSQSKGMNRSMQGLHRLEEVDLAEGLWQRPSELVVACVEDAQGRKEWLVAAWACQRPTALQHTCFTDANVVLELDRKPSRCASLAWPRPKCQKEEGMGWQEVIT